MPDTCSLFPPFGDPWPSHLLPSHVHHQHLEFTQTHVHWVGDAIQPSHPLSSPSPVLNLSQNQGFFPVSQLFASGGQSIGVSVSTSVLLTNTQDWSPLGWTRWISLQSKDSQESFPTPQFKSISFLVLSLLYCPTLTSIHDHGNHLTRWTFVGKVMSLLFNMLSWLVCDYCFNVSALWCPLTTPTVLLGFLLPWTHLLGYLFTAAPEKRSCCSLPWMRGIFSRPPLLTLKVE